MTIKSNIQFEEHWIGQQLEHMSSVQEQEELCYFLYLYLVVLREVMRPAAEPNMKNDAGNVLQVLVLVQVKVQMEVQVEVQQMPFLLVLLVAEVVKQHTSVPNLEANSCKQEQVEAHRGVEEEAQKHPTELPELGVETYDIQGSPKPSGHVHFVGPHSEHVPELSEVFDP
jgi:hypothetical protein